MLACFQLAHGEDGDSDHARMHASKAIVYPAPIPPLFQLYRARVSKLKQKRNLRLMSISLIAYKRRNKKMSANHHRAWEAQSYRELKYLNSWILPCLLAGRCILWHSHEGGFRQPPLEQYLWRRLVQRLT